MNPERNIGLLEGHAELLWLEAGATVPFEDASHADRLVYLGMAEEELSEIIGPNGADA